MTEQKEAEPVNPPLPRKLRPKPLDFIAPLGPVEKEQVARMLDAYVDSYARQNAEIAALPADVRRSPSVSGQFEYGRVAIGVLQHLAWTVRTSRGGPLSGKKRAKKQQ